MENLDNMILFVVALWSRCYLVLIDFSNISESQPYQELEQGSTGESEGTGLGHLRLDDDNEFPPMTHKSD